MKTRSKRAGKQAVKSQTTSRQAQSAIRHTRTVMLDHISLPVRDLEAARAFYSAALGAIGMRINLDFSTAFGFGSRDENIFWLTRDRKASGHGHYAFRVEHREEVAAFHAAALAAGGKDNGKPGPRPEYHPDFYGAFVVDLNGIHLEACVHRPE